MKVTRVGNEKSPYGSIDACLRDEPASLMPQACNHKLADFFTSRLLSDLLQNLRRVK